MPDNMKRRILLLCALTALLLGVPASVPTAFGASNDRWAVEPSGPNGPGGRPYFVYSLNPGEIFQDTVGVTNSSDRPITFALYSTDAYTVPGEGGFAALRDDETPIDAGTWVKLPVDQITVEPGTRADVPIQIEVPIDAEPGDHAAVILAADSELQLGQESDGLSLAVRQRVGARVYVRVSGPLTPSIRIDNIDVEHSTPLNPLSSGEATISYQISNVGNIRLSPSLQLKITGILGRTVKTLPPNTIDDVLPGGVIRITESVTGLPRFEPLAASLQVVSPEFATDSSTTFYPVPWITVILLLLAIVLFYAWIRVRRAREGDELTTPELPPAPKELTV